MSDITIYYNPFCVVSRNALTLIRHAGIEPTVIDYLRNQPSREKLVELLGAMQAPVRALVRVHSPYGADLGLYDTAWTDDALLDLVLERPAFLPAVGDLAGAAAGAAAAAIRQRGRKRRRGSRHASLVDEGGSEGAHRARTFDPLQTDS